MIGAVPARKRGYGSLDSSIRRGTGGGCVGDAGHWYYDRAALLRDYGRVDQFMAPRNPHPGSILWRSNYEALNARGDILREQAVFWGQQDIHYHQFLEAGENTLNFKLAAELFDWTKVRGAMIQMRG